MELILNFETLKNTVIQSIVSHLSIVWLQKISLPRLWSVTGSSEGGGGEVGGIKRSKFAKESIRLKMQFLKGWGVQIKKPFKGRVWTVFDTNFPANLPSGQLCR